MATQEDVRRIALGLPGASEEAGRFAFSVDNKGKPKAFAWVWNERIEPKKPRVPNPDVLAVRVAGEEAKQFLIGAVPGTFFTEPHYNGFPAVLLRLGAIEAEQLESLIIDGWRCQAPKALVREFDAKPD
jgi:hypothetical protein